MAPIEDTNVHVVAHHLQIHAISITDSQARDLFGRSSYNRYYYATFLLVRSTLVQMRPEWGRAAHASIPEILTTSICRVLNQGRVRARKLGDMEMERRCHRAIKAARDLAHLMHESSATRVVADYQPEITVNFLHASRFSLNNVEITDAHQWPDRAAAWLHEIYGTWVQIND